MLIYNHLFHFLDFPSHLFKFSKVFIVVFDGEGTDEVNDFLLVFNWVDPPVVDNEFELWNFLVWIRDFFIAIKWLAHDGNKHIKHMNAHNKTQKNK